MKQRTFKLYAVVAAFSLMILGAQAAQAQSSLFSQADSAIASLNSSVSKGSTGGVDSTQSSSMLNAPAGNISVISQSTQQMISQSQQSGPAICSSIGGLWTSGSCKVQNAAYATTAGSATSGGGGGGGGGSYQTCYNASGPYLAPAGSGCGPMGYGGR